MKKELESMTVGSTKVVNGKVVTKWSADCYEVGTWGREDNQVNLIAAIDRIEKIEGPIF